MQLVSTNIQKTVKGRIKLWTDYYSALEDLSKIKEGINKLGDSEGKSKKLATLNGIKKYPEEISNIYLNIASDISQIDNHKKVINNKELKISDFEQLVIDSELEIRGLNEKIRQYRNLFYLIIPLFLIKGQREKLEGVKQRMESYHKEFKVINDELANHKLAITKLIDSIRVNYKDLSRLISDFQLAELNRFSDKWRNKFDELPIYQRWDWSIREEYEAGMFLETKSSNICIGHFEEKLSDLEFKFPASISLMGQNVTTFLPCNKETLEDSNSFMESLIIKLLYMLHPHVRFTFFDPAGFGTAFPISKDVPTRSTNFDISRTLDEIMADMQRIITTFGLAGDQMLHHKILEEHESERLEFILVANFPREYDRYDIEKLQRIGKIGPIAGKYLIIQNNTGELSMEDPVIEGFSNRSIVDIYNTEDLGGTQCKFQFLPISKPDQNTRSSLLSTIHNYKKPERIISWEDAVSINEADWWQKDSVCCIETPLGLSSSSSKMSIWFGKNKSLDDQICSHGILAGMPGSGKSNLYHVLILGLAIRYNPEELSFYLIDGKDGVEFQFYRDLPHAEFISLNTQPELARSILGEIVAEMDRRYDIFKAIGAQNLEDYRIESREKMPWILLLVDEFQDLFEDDKDGIASNHLNRLAAQGRAAGIAMLLGSQGFSAPGMMHRESIMKNIHLRIAMKMSLNARQTISGEFGKEGKELIGKCDQPGKLVINTAGGDDGMNITGKVVLMEKIARDKMINQLISKYSESEISGSIAPANVFQGTEQPRYIDNPFVQFLAASDFWLTEGELEKYARQEVHLGGLGESGWYTGESPIAGWIGQEFNARGHARIILRNKKGENAILLGNNNSALYGMMGSLIISFVLNYGPERSVFYFFDNPTPGTPWEGVISRINENYVSPLKYTSIYSSQHDEQENLIELLYSELQIRLGNSTNQAYPGKNIYIFSTSLEKLEGINQVENKYGTKEDSELGKKLLEILNKGPAAGIHTIMSFDNYSSLSNVIAKRKMDLFNHRVGLQMSEDDSFNFIKKRSASQLQKKGKVPIRSIYVEISNNRETEFKPYFTGDKWFEDIERIVNIIKNRT